MMKIRFIFRRKVTFLTSKSLFMFKKETCIVIRIKLNNKQTNKKKKPSKIINLHKFHIKLL